MRTDIGQVFKLEDYRPIDYLIPKTMLTFKLSPEKTTVVAMLSIERREATDPSAPLVLAGDGPMRLARVAMDGRPLATRDYVATEESLTITRLPSAHRFTLEIETHLAPAQNEALMGLYRSNGVYCTQCEAEGFRRITYFLDRPDVLSVYTVRIEADKSEAPLL